MRLYKPAVYMPAHTMRRSAAAAAVARHRAAVQALKDDNPNSSQYRRGYLASRCCSTPMQNVAHEPPRDAGPSNPYQRR